MKMLSTQITSTDFENSLGMLGTEHQLIMASVTGEDWAELGRLLIAARRVHVTGKGRSLLVGSMAAMRWMHLGLTVHVVGEVTAPAIAKGDLLVAISGSGTTAAVIRSAEAALGQGATVATISAVQESPLSRLSSHHLMINAPEKHSGVRETSEQYAGSLFEQAVMLMTEALFHAMWQTSGLSAEQMLRRHADL